MTDWVGCFQLKQCHCDIKNEKNETIKNEWILNILSIRFEQNAKTFHIVSLV